MLVPTFFKVWKWTSRKDKIRIAPLVLGHILDKDHAIAALVDASGTIRVQRAINADEQEILPI